MVGRTKKSCPNYWLHEMSGSFVNLQIKLCTQYCHLIKGHGDGIMNKIKYKQLGIHQMHTFM